MIILKLNKVHSCNSLISSSFSSTFLCIIMALRPVAHKPKVVIRSWYGAHANSTAWICSMTHRLYDVVCSASSIYSVGVCEVLMVKMIDGRGRRCSEVGEHLASYAPWGVHFTGSWLGPGVGVSSCISVQERPKTHIVTQQQFYIWKRRKKL